MSNEPNTIMPSLKKSLTNDIDILDEFFMKLDKENQEVKSWDNVREAAISFTEIFDNLKDIDIKEGLLPPTL